MAITSHQLEDFLHFLKQFASVTEEELAEYFLPVVRIREFGKKQLITRAGDVENYINFVQKGLVRKYYLHESEERIVQLAIEGHLISSQESLYMRTPSDYYIETIEPATLISVANEDLEKMFARSHSMERMGRLITVHSMVLIDKRQMSLIKQSPRDRFLNFMENYPEIVQRVPQKYIASFLNIKPETFSRFKHLTRSGKRPANKNKIGIEF